MAFYKFHFNPHCLIKLAAGLLEAPFPPTHWLTTTRLRVRVMVRGSSWAQWRAESETWDTHTHTHASTFTLSQSPLSHFIQNDFRWTAIACPLFLRPRARTQLNPTTTELVQTAAANTALSVFFRIQVNLCSIKNCRPDWLQSGSEAERRGLKVGVEGGEGAMQEMFGR